MMRKWESKAPENDQAALSFILLVCIYHHSAVIWLVRLKKKVLDIAQCLYDELNFCKLLYVSKRCGVMNKTPAAALFKIVCKVPNTLRPHPAGLHVKICGSGWGGKKIRRVWTHTLSCLFFVVFDFSVGFCRMGESISCTLGRHMLGKNLKIVSAVSILFCCSCV